MGEKIKFEQVPIDKIALDIRDDINLRTYVLLNRAGHVWKQFLKGCNEHGINPRSYEKFLELYQDIRVNGMRVPIKAQKIEGKFYVEDGAHRLSVVRALGMSFVDIEIVTNCGVPSVFIAVPKTVEMPEFIAKAVNANMNNPRILKVFKHVEKSAIEKIVNLDMETDKEKIPMSGAAVFWPTCKSLWPEMLEDVKSFHQVEKIIKVKCSKESTMQSMIVDFYKSDDVALWKVEAKFPYCSETDWDFLVVKFNIEDARHRIKRKTGNEISMAIEDLKSYIRKKYRPRVKNYPSSGTPDLLIHAGDNEYQTKEILETLIRFENNSSVSTEER